MTIKTWTVTLEEDPETGDLILPFSDEMLADVGWQEGDTLEWIDNKNGSWSLIKKEINIENNIVNLFAPIMYKFKFEFDWANLKPLVDEHLNKASQNSDLERGDTQSSVYVSHNQPHTWKEFEPFVKWLDPIITKLTKINNFDNNNYKITWSWFNKHSLNGSTNEHCHGSETFVIVCYLKCEPNSGNIVFMDPLEYHKSTYPTNQMFPEKFKYKELEVTTNDVVIFPGWLKHSVKPNQTNSDRYILSINVTCG